MAEEDALRAGDMLAEETPEQATFRTALEMLREATHNSERDVETILELRRRLKVAEVAVADTDMRQVLEMLHAIDRRLTVVERDRDDAVPGPRVKLFVAEVIAPIKESVGEIKNSMRTMADESRELYEAHKAFIAAEQKRKEEDQKEKTLKATLLRWGAISAAVGSILVALRIAGTFLELWIQARGGK